MSAWRSLRTFGDQVRPMVTMKKNGNSQNVRLWSGFPPEAVDKRSLHSPKLTMDMHLTLIAQGIIDSLLFESIEKTIRVNQRRENKVSSSFLLHCTELETARKNIRSSLVHSNGFLGASEKK